MAQRRKTIPIVHDRSGPAPFRAAGAGFAAPTGIGTEHARCCAVYCRVSTPKQKLNGHGLESQEANCRAYAKMRGYTVVAVFRDDVTGASDHRDGFAEVLAFLEGWSPAEAGPLVVVIDEIKRFARDVMVHFEHKQEIARRGGRLESPGFVFEDTPEGRFNETIFAAQAELERHQNARQVKSRMRARLEAGFWVFPAPPGYRFADHPEHKRLMVPETPRAALVKEALEGYASRRFASPTEIERFLVDNGFYGPSPKPQAVAQRLTQIAAMLKNVAYTGHVEFLPWGVTLRKGRHEGIITLATFEAIQERLEVRLQRLESKRRRPAHVDMAELFELRGHVVCDACGRPMTGSVTRKRNGREYPYYYCFFRTCALYGKTVPVKRMHEDFGKRLEQEDAPQWKVDCLRTVAVDYVRSESEHRERCRKEAAASLVRLNRQIAGLIEKIAMAESPAVVAALDRKVAEMSRTKAQLEETLTEKRGDSGGGAEAVAEEVRTLFERVAPILFSPSHTWKSGNPSERSGVSRMVFLSAIRYRRRIGFRTAQKTLPYRLIDAMRTPDSALVDLQQISSELREDKVWREFWETLRVWDQRYPTSEPPTG